MAKVAYQPPTRREHTFVMLGDDIVVLYNFASEKSLFVRRSVLSRSEVRQHAATIGVGATYEAMPGLCFHGQRSAECGACPRED